MASQLQGGLQLTCPFRCPPPDRVVINYAVRALVELLASGRGGRGGGGGGGGGSFAAAAAAGGLARAGSGAARAGSGAFQPGSGCSGAAAAAAAAAAGGTSPHSESGSVARTGAARVLGGWRVAAA